jgi:hypothetical protein
MRWNFTIVQMLSPTLQTWWTVGATGSERERKREIDGKKKYDGETNDESVCLGFVLSKGSTVCLKGTVLRD